MVNSKTERLAQSVEEQLRDLQRRLDEERREDDRAQEGSMVTMSVVLPRALYDHLNARAGTTDTSKAEMTRRALAQYTGFDLSSIDYISRSPRRHYRSDAERKETVKERQQRARRLSRLAEDIAHEGTQEAQELRRLLEKRGLSLS